jgi:hypothetical protein
MVSLLVLHPIRQMTGRKGQHCLRVRVCWGLLVEWRSLYEKTCET